MSFENFTIMGGSMHAVASRLRPTDPYLGIQAFGNGIAAVLWTVLAALAFIDGQASLFFSLGSLVVHAQLLVLVPLLLNCEVLFDRAVRDFCTSSVRMGIVRDRTLDARADLLSRLRRFRLLEIGVLVLAILLTALGWRQTQSAALPVIWSGSPDVGFPALLWYWAICLPIVRFITIRFVVLFLIWTCLLWFVSRQNLALKPSHPDGMGGLGLVTSAQGRLVMVVAIIATINAAALAQGAHLRPLDVNTIYIYISAIALIGLVMVCGPLMFFVSTLRQHRRTGLVQFTELSHSYSRSFEKKWMRSGVAGEEPLLGSSDIQSLADIGTAFSYVRDMRMIPVSREMVIRVVLWAAVPFLPLSLLIYPIAEIIPVIFKNIVGF